MPMLPRGDHKPIESALRRPPQGPVHLVPFIPAGFGGYQATSAAVLGVAEAGASVIELGVPFSDPVADGPVIQAAYDDALKRGTTVPGSVASASPQWTSRPASSPSKRCRAAT